MKKIIASLIALALMATGMVAAPTLAFAEGETSSGYTSILTECETAEAGGGEGIYCILRIALKILTYGVGIVGVLGLVWAGILYLTSGDKEAQMQKAKTRIFEIVVGLAAYAIMWLVLDWLIPGGLIQ